MSWRRGEVWFDADVLWFGERAGAAAVAVAGFAPAPALGSPPHGLVASRRRREAWKQRRDARRLRMAALALAPAVIFPLAALRNGSGQGASVGAEDPPSLTFRLGAGTIAAVDELAPRTGDASKATALPKIEWNRASSVGLPYGGSLLDGTRLPVEGPDWVTWSPVTESVPNVPWRLFGHERTIRTVLAVTAQYRAANPSAPRVVVGDISFRDGGPMTDEHVSHQNGLDVDVYYPRLDGTPRAPLAPDEVDRRRAQDLLDRFVAAGAQVVFVGYSTGLHGPTGVVTPYPNHENHMHVRFPPPGG